MVDEDIWPPASTIPLVPPDPALIRTVMSEMMLEGRVVHYDILEEIYAEINAMFGSNAQVPRQQ